MRTVTMEVTLTGIDHTVFRALAENRSPMLATELSELCGLPPGVVHLCLGYLLLEGLAESVGSESGPRWLLSEHGHLVLATGRIP